MSLHVDNHAGVKVFLWAGMCPICHKDYTLRVPKDGYDKWKDGTLIQDAFPNMGPGDRELMQTGICNECWDKLYKEDEDGI